ncbi:MAG TPA: hypothetical protein VMU27_00345 [Candidatus Paceibacterota bacterium]|nr:hypothetical protein [Candidatus Paceibacterota bacterium]
MAENNNDRDRDNRDMTVSEAGHRGGERVRELIEEGKEMEGGTDDRTNNSRNRQESDYDMDE